MLPIRLSKREGKERDVGIYVWSVMAFRCMSVGHDNRKQYTGTLTYLMNERCRL
jgi:hypothetical protein